MRIKEAIKLYNYRNKGGDRMTQLRLGGELMNVAGLGTIRVTMYNLCSGAREYVPIRYITKICDVLGVDPNFLFGYPSKHDKEFNQMLTNKK